MEYPVDPLPFYVIYRRSGLRHSFPSRVQDRDRVVHIIVVDIAATDEHGSSAPSTRVFEVAELVPGAAILADPPRWSRLGATIDALYGCADVNSYA